ncbi:hypothetical protein IGL98_002396 [Enterococcus sp. DIV0840]
MWKRYVAVYNNSEAGKRVYFWINLKTKNITHN